MRDYATDTGQCPESDGINPASSQKFSCLAGLSFLARVLVRQSCLLLFWKMIFSAKAILFDMDGVLINSAPAVERVWNIWASSHGLNPVSVVNQAHGRRSIETIRAVAPELDAEKENIVVEQMEIDDREGVTALPGAAGLLQSLPADRFALVTSATRPLAVARMGYAALPVPANLVTADDVVDGKPSPEPYLKGAALLGFAAGDCLVFEDTPAGIAAGQAAGMRVVALQTTYPMERLHAAETVVASLAHVSAELRQGTILLTIDAMAETIRRSR
jgi:sugar-phosphatase